MPREPFVALVTGASSGIGESTARRLARGLDGSDVALVLLARREERLRALAEQLQPTPSTVLALDLTDADTPTRVREALEREHGGRLHLLVNNAGRAWRGTFAETGWGNLERHMKLNFEAPARLTEALLPLLRATAADEKIGNPPTRRPTRPPTRRVSIVNVASTAARVSRPKTGAYSASKFALAAWSDALHSEEAANGVHVGLVLPGFVQTEGFPARELRERALTRWIVSQPEVVARAIIQAGPGGKAERYVPRPYWLAAALRILAPGLIRRATRGGAFTTSTGHAAD